jgi:uncharacterized protein YbjT (DUF2867 family)
MKVLLTGANSYIGTGLLPVLLEKGHEVICLVRNKHRFKNNNNFGDSVKLITGDLLKETVIEPIPPDVDVAYYLVHSIANTPEFGKMEALSAHNFVKALNHTNCKQLIFLSSITGSRYVSQQHKSRKLVELILKEAKAAVTILCTSIIIGRGSPWFDVICGLAEKHAIITVPQWAKNKHQPIAITDVLFYLEAVLLNEKALDQTFDIGGPDVLRFTELVLTYASMRKLDRKIVVLPFSSPKLSLYWLYFATRASYPAAQSLIASIPHEGIMHDHRIDDVVAHKCLNYREALAPVITGVNPNNECINNNAPAVFEEKDEIIKK